MNKILKVVGIITLAGAGIYVALQVIPAVYPPLAWLPIYVTDKVYALYETVKNNPIIGMGISAIGTAVTMAKVMGDKLTGAKEQATQQINAVTGQTNEVIGELNKVTDIKDSVSQQLEEVRAKFDSYRDTTDGFVTKNTELFTENKALAEALKNAEIQVLEMKNTILEQKTPTLG